MKDYTSIDTNAEFSAYIQRLKARGVSTIALDIEGEFNLHVYGERLCLLQLFDGKEATVVDPLTVSGNLLKEFLENRDLLKVMYDCSSDRVLLAKTHGIVLNTILDLRPAVELLEFPKQDLKSVLASALRLQETGSKKRFQQYNWTRRPLDEQAVEYALGDVRHLFRLKDELLARLATDGLTDRFIHENLKRQDQVPDVNRLPGLFRSGRHKRLNREQKQVFQRLYDIRERHAKELDLPPNTVVANNDLFALVNGEIRVSDIRGNRRIPAAILDKVKQELGEAL